jgi:hypothetical protein
LAGHDSGGFLWRSQFAANQKSRRTALEDQCHAQQSDKDIVIMTLPCTVAHV